LPAYYLVKDFGYKRQLYCATDSLIENTGQIHAVDECKLASVSILDRCKSVFCKLGLRMLERLKY